MLVKLKTEQSKGHSSSKILELHERPPFKICLGKPLSTFIGCYFSALHGSAFSI